MQTEQDNLSELLERLTETTEAIPFSRLYGFSDLTGARLLEFRAAWDNLPTAQRRRLSRALAELAEASFEVNFDAIFHHCLDDPDEEVRAAAIDGLWENEEVKLIGPLLAMLRADPSPRVRAAAATGLGRFVLRGELEQLEPAIQSRITTELLTTYHLAGESVEVRRRGLESLAYACAPEVLDVLETAYYDEDESMRISAVVGMGRSCDKRWGDILLTELESTSAAMRYEAALAAGEIALRQAVPVLARTIDDADHQVREASIWALGQIGGEQAKGTLLAAYEGADAEARASIEDALAEHALAEGELDFAMYIVDEDMAAEPLDDELYTLWSAEDEDFGEPGLSNWDLDQP
jgi:HEAT repeat protein